MKILIDMNLSPAWVDFFEKHSIPAQHWISVGNPNDPDIVIFDYARENDFIIFTNDLDFGTILAVTNAKSPSVFQIKSHELLPQLIGESVVKCLINYESYFQDGSLITLDTLKTRLRILPLNKNS